MEVTIDKLYSINSKNRVHHKAFN
uniref:Uncharacterized protein n=1 Tax=Rhizophora mucronata TaxID=61149 RepID=A0A2P2QTM3_RHIMU